MCVFIFLLRDTKKKWFHNFNYQYQFGLLLLTSVNTFLNLDVKCISIGFRLKVEKYYKQEVKACQSLRE